MGVSVWVFPENPRRAVSQGGGGIGLEGFQGNRGGGGGQGGETPLP